jgi:hypothetical protein
VDNPLRPHSAPRVGADDGREVAEETVVKFQVPPESAGAVVAGMIAAGYDTELLPGGEVRVWIFAHQSAFQAELQFKQLAPAARLVSTRPCA